MVDTTATTTQESFGQEIVDDLKIAWSKVEWFGEQALKGGEAFAQEEYNAVKGALVSVGGEFLPAQLTKLRGWVKDYVAEVGQMGDPIKAAEYCIAKDAAEEVQFLSGELSLGLHAVSAAFLNELT